MATTVSCPGCAMALGVPPELAGKKVLCPGCGTELTLPKPRPAAAAPPPPPPPPPASQWYVASGAATPFGPYSAEQIRGMLQAGQILPETPLWTQGAPAWAAAAAFAEFASVVPAPEESAAGDDESGDDRDGGDGDGGQGDDGGQGPDLANALTVGKFMARRIPGGARRKRGRAPIGGIRRRIGGGGGGFPVDLDAPAPGDSGGPVDVVDLGSIGPADSVTAFYTGGVESSADPADSAPGDVLGALASAKRGRRVVNPADFAPADAGSDAPGEETDEVIGAVDQPSPAPARPAAPAPAPAAPAPAPVPAGPPAPAGGAAVRYAGGSFPVPPGADGFLVYGDDTLAFLQRKPEGDVEIFRTPYRAVTGAQIQAVEGGASVLSIAFQSEQTLVVGHFAESAVGPMLPAILNVTAERIGPGRRNKLIALFSAAGPLARRDVVLLIDGLKDDDAQVRQYSAARLAATGPADAAGLPALIAELRKRGEFHILKAVAVALGNLGPAGAKGVSALVETLALLAQARRGKTAAPRGLRFLCTPYEGTNEPMLRESAEAVRAALGKIGPEAAKAVPALLQDLESDDEAARLSAAAALSRISPDAAAQAAAQTAAQAGGGQPLIFLCGTATDISPNAAGILIMGADGLMFAPATGAASPKNSFRVPYAAVVRTVVGKGEEFGDDVKRAVQAVDPTSLTGRILLIGVRRAGGIGFAAFKRPSGGRDLEIVLSKVKAAMTTSTPGPVGGLVRQLMSDRPDLRYGAVDALAKMGGEARAALPALAEVLRQADKPLRIAVYKAMGPICQEAQAIGSATAVGLHHLKMRKAAYKHAVACLERVRPIVKAGYLTLVEGLGDGDADVRAAALASIYEIANSSGQPVATGFAELTAPLTSSSGAKQAGPKSRAMPPVAIPPAETPIVRAAPGGGG